MDSPAPVSAFAVYASKKNSNKEKKRKKRNQTVSANVAQQIPEEILIGVAQKLKKQQKKTKVTKNKKTHKKKRPQKEYVKHRSQPVNPIVPEKEEVPELQLVYDPSSINEEGNLSSEPDDDYINFVPVETDSALEGLKVFKWLIAPYNPKEFLNRVWEKKPLHISRNKPDYYKQIISTPAIDDMLRNENIQYTKNIDITSYVNGKRETHNTEGRAYPYTVWDYYLNGCSVRLLNPQTYIHKLHMLNSTLQEYFNSFVGANAYLTPPDSQGFAPHYDDIEAFILQTEGKKHWRIYKPLSENETLPRVSSKNFDQDEIGEPIMEVTLEAGDMLYFPRGYIHQGVTINGQHSLHVTISMYQKHSWADLLEKLVPAALQMAIGENIDLRQGLPFDIYDNFGIVHSESTKPRRKEIENIIHSLFDKVKKYLPIDDAVDQMSKNYQHDALPPVLTDSEKAVTVFGDSDMMIENGAVVNRVEMALTDRVRLLRKNIVRMVSEDTIRLYYYVENSLEYHGNELQFLEVEPEMAPGIENLINAYPQYISIESLNLPTETEKVHLAEALWSRGLIMTEQPMEVIED